MLQLKQRAAAHAHAVRACAAQGGHRACCPVGVDEVPIAA